MANNEKNGQQKQTYKWNWYWSSEVNTQPTT